MALLPGWANNPIRIRIPAGSVTGTLTDFPLLVRLSSSSGTNDADLSAVFTTLGSDANRKKIAVTTGDGITQCYVEIADWSTTNQQAFLWVKVPQINPGEDTYLYLYYDAGHADNTTYVGDTGEPAAQAVWSAGFAGVWHMKPSGGQVLDSTANGRNLTINGDVTYGADADGRRWAKFDIGEWANTNVTPAVVNGAAEITIELALELDNLDTQTWNQQMFFGQSSPAGARFYLAAWGTPPIWACAIGNLPWSSNNSPPCDENLTHISWVVDKTAVTARLYVNASEVENKTGWTLGDIDQNLNLAWAVGQEGAPGLLPYASDCTVFALKVSTVVRSPAWVAANNASLMDALCAYTYQAATTPDDSGSVWGVYHGSLGELAGVTKVRVQDAYLRFARKATVEIIDPDGAIAADTPRDTSILLYAAPSPRSPLQLRFGGFVVDVRTNENVTTLDLLSYDFWLKRRVVYKTYTDTGLRDIAHDLVTTLTPLVWDPAQVDLTNDIVISQVWKGEALDSVLAQIAAMSKSEEWGADDEGRFFFREQDVRTSRRHFTEGWYTDARFEEDGRMEVNRVVIYYGQPPNTGAVAVQDRAAQLALQNRYGAPRPVVIEVARTYPEITTEEDARNRAAAILANRTVIRTGEIETWGAVRVRPGDVCAVRVPDQRIDGSYRVAQIEYAYPEDQTVVKLAENNEGVVDVLVELSDEVSRIDARDADPDATLLEVVNLLEEVEIETELAVYVIHVAAGVFLFGEPGGNLGDPHAGGGVLGDPGGRTRVI